MRGDPWHQEPPLEARSPEEVEALQYILTAIEARPDEVSFASGSHSRSAPE